MKRIADAGPSKGTFVFAFIDNWRCCAGPCKDLFGLFELRVAFCMNEDDAGRARERRHRQVQGNREAESCGVCQPYDQRKYLVQTLHSRRPAMRKFLLTWYGITDFRASLGFENTDGPIAAALATEAYSDVVILCYTRADNDSNECVEAQKSFAAKLASIRDAGQEKDWKTTGEFVSRFANTAIVH